MKLLRKSLLVALFVINSGLAQPPALQGTSKSPRLPGIDQVLERLITAVGGDEALRRHSTRRIVGEIEIEGMNITGSFESIASTPARSVTSFDIPGIGQFRQVVDGEKGWAIDPLSGLRELAGAELSAYIRDADFQRELNFRKLFSRLEVVSRVRLGDQEAFKVNAIPALGEAEQFYFDTTSGLLIRHDTRRESPQGVLPSESFFSDFRIVDGVRLPMRIRQQTPAFTINLTFREVSHNISIDEAKFVRPSAP